MYLLQVEIGGVTVFTISGKHVEVQISDESTSLGLIIPHAKYRDILVPHDVTTFAAIGQLVSFLAWSDLDEGQAKQLLEDLQHALDGTPDREILGDLFLIDRILLFDHQTMIESMIPEEVMMVVALFR